MYLCTSNKIHILNDKILFNNQKIIQLHPIVLARNNHNYIKYELLKSKISRR